MSSRLNKLFSYPSVPDFAQKNLQEFRVEANKVMIVLLLIQWFVATTITSIAYDTYLYGFFGGALITLPIIFLYKYLKEDVFYRSLIAMAMILFSVIYIQQYLGLIEMHFHVFIAMAILTLYKDIVPLIVAAATTILHHLIFNYLQLYEVSLFDMPVMVFNYGCGLDIVFLHAVFVLLELAVLGYFIKLQIEHTIDLNSSKNRVNMLNKKLEYTSLHDNLTGLPNRLYLSKEMEIIKENAVENGNKFALVFLDLDHFKNINDTLGHDVGDALLQTLANIMQETITINNLITRIGGDEFIIVISDINDAEDLLPIIKRLMEEFKRDLYIKGYSLRLSASIGVSIFPDDSSNITELMKFADIAMYNAKKEGRDGFSFFTQMLNSKIHNEVDIVNDMQRAFYDKEFELYYQPKVDTLTKKIIGAEALLRWKQHNDNFIRPDIFIPLAENTGFILTLGKFVIEESTKAIARFNELGLNDLIISINISTRQFQNRDLFEELKQEIQNNKIQAKQLGIEITETIMMQYISNTLATLQEIKKLGVSIYIDDFGTGYSSLSYLKQFPIDVLKIDKAFIDDIDEEGNNDTLLLNTILAMGQSLKLVTVAEGVESKYQYEYLKEMGCDIIQGYYFAKPMDEKSFIELLQKGRVVE